MHHSVSQVLHLVGTLQQTTGRDVQICTFNAKHIIDVPEYKHHLEHCRDRGQLDRIISEKMTERKTPREHAASVTGAAGVLCCGVSASLIAALCKLTLYSAYDVFKQFYLNDSWTQLVTSNGRWSHYLSSLPLSTPPCNITKGTYNRTFNLYVGMSYEYRHPSRFSFSCWVEALSTRSDYCRAIG